MPELPEVETIRRALEKRITGYRIRTYNLLREDYLHSGHSLLPHVAGGKIEDIQRKGKFLTIFLCNDLVLIHHLGMSGRLLLLPSHEPLEKHTHLIIHFQQKSFELRHWDPRRFGLAAIIERNALHNYPSIQKLAPDPYELNLREFALILDNRQRPIKSLLLDQHLISGVGNIYADEALFRARIHPGRPCKEIRFQEAKKLLHALRRVMDESIAAGGSSTDNFMKLDGSLGEFQHKHRVYGKEGTPCHLCRKEIKKIILGGRSTHFCPFCQK